MELQPNAARRAHLTHRNILTLWLPLAGTWIMMSVEGPYLAAIIARLEAPVLNLAAFGVAFALAIIIESPVMMLMSASTALVNDRESYRALRRFSYGLGALLTVVQLVTLAPPIFSVLAGCFRCPTMSHGSRVADWRSCCPGRRRSGTADFARDS